MTIQEAKTLKWGTVLRPTQKQHRMFRRRRQSRNALYLGVTRDKQGIKVVARGTSTAEAWHPSFWAPVLEVR